MSQPYPPVSIVLPTFNGSRYIASAIGSCLKQTYSNLELIIVDGGSTDDTLAIVAQYQDPRIRVVHQPANSGRLPGALNIGFAQAAGDYFTWIQDDDLWTSDALEMMVGVLDARPDIGLVYAGFWFIDANGQIIRESEMHAPADMVWTNPVGHAFLYRRSVAMSVGGYDVDYLMAEDFHYWARIFKQFEMLAIPRRLGYHRLHPGSLTVHNYGSYEALRVAARARREVLGISRVEYRRQLAAASVEEAFSAYDHHDLARVRRCLARGLTLDPRWLSNAGIVSIALESVLGSGVMARLRGVKHRGMAGLT